MADDNKGVVKRPGELDIEGFSNAIRLTGHEWVGVALFGVVLLLLAPVLWLHIEAFNLEPDYRIPYQLSTDYWLYERYARLAAADYDTLVLGDSVIWGEYVTRPQTLSHYLNQHAGKEQFANLGLDGAHPAALSGLVTYYGKRITNRNVLLQCNPLWLTSSKQDMQEDEPSQLLHLRLIPQFAPAIPSYKEQISPRLGVIVERQLPFNGWTQHLQLAYFQENDMPRSIPEWTVEHPYECPLEPLSRALPPSDSTLRHSPIPWYERGIEKQSFPWVEPSASFQWRCFQETVNVLRERGNRVLVVVGPFNEHLLKDESLTRYRVIRTEIEQWLGDNGVEHLAPPVLPSAEYGDSSHPLAAGYSRLAAWLWQEPSFERWNTTR